MVFRQDEASRELVVLSADARLLFESQQSFVQELDRYIDLGARKLIIDCTQLTRISSYGLGTLTLLHGRLADKGGAIKLASVADVVGKVIDMTGLGTMLPIYPTVSDARQAFEVTNR
jgi:anti-sigma B factor antagonist